MNIFGIIPLAGNATRMKNIPKFLLPCKNNYSLLDNTIEIFNKNNIQNIISGVSLINDTILGNFTITKIVMSTKTMSETVHNIIKHIDENILDKTPIYKNILIMPDTYFTINTELNDMINMLNKYDIVVIVWKIKDYQIGKVGQCKIINNEIRDVIDKDISCNYEHFWGIIGWNSSMNKYIDPSWETIGLLINRSIELNIKVGSIVCDSNYYDCGTYLEYFKMINTL